LLKKNARLGLLKKVPDPLIENVVFGPNGRSALRNCLDVFLKEEYFGEQAKRLKIGLPSTFCRDVVRFLSSFFEIRFYPVSLSLDTSRDELITFLSVEGVDVIVIPKYFGKKFPLSLSQIEAVKCNFDKIIFVGDFCHFPFYSSVESRIFDVIWGANRKFFVDRSVGFCLINSEKLIINETSAPLSISVRTRDCLWSVIRWLYPLSSRYRHVYRFLKEIFVITPGFSVKESTRELGFSELRMSALALKLVQADLLPRLQDQLGMTTACKLNSSIEIAIEMGGILLDDSDDFPLVIACRDWSLAKNISSAICDSCWMWPESNFVQESSPQYLVFY